MQNINKIRNIITSILLINILSTIIIFILMYNNIVDFNSENVHNKLINLTFIFFIINIIISGTLMILMYNNLTKWSEEEQKTQISISELQKMIENFENEKKEKQNIENTIKISQNDFIAKFANCKNLKEVANSIFKEIAKNIQITSAIFYIKDRNVDEFIPISTFALIYDEISNFKIGEGLNGQVAKSKKELILNSLDEKYFNIVSGLGVAKPTCLAIFPVIIDNNVEGIVELSSFISFTNEEIQFFNTIFSGLSEFKNIESI